MKDEKDVMDLIQEFPESQELNPNLTNKAKLLAEELYGEKKKKHKGLWWKILTAVLVPCCLVVAILTPILLKKSSTSNTPSRYFNNQEVTWEYTNISEYLKINPIAIRYFSMDSSENEERKYTIKATNELAYFEQGIIVFSEEYIDLLTLFIVPSNDTFESMKAFNDLELKLNYRSINIDYQQSYGENMYITDAKFTFESVHYYLTVKASDPNRWQTYVAELIG